VSSPKRRQEEPVYDPRADGYGEDQAKEREAYEEGKRRFEREVANGEWDQEEN